MSYKQKTLIVFDTNSLRSTEAGKIAYSFFAFGRPYQIIDSFIKANDLSGDVHIAVPEWAIEELKDQKQRQFLDDVKAYEELAKRLSGLPHIGDLKLPNEDFDCAAYVTQKAQEYLTGKNIQLLTITEAISNDVLRSMMIRVMKVENEKAPFAHSGKYKDAGFKDNLVWESLMHYPNVTAYDKVIVVSKDGDFKTNCISEFRAKWERHITIQQDENNVLGLLQKDYGNYIGNRKVYDYAQQEYFDKYLKNLLNESAYIQLDGDDLPIQNYMIQQHCERVEVVKDEEGEFDKPVIISSVIIYTVHQGEKICVPCEIKTGLSDFEYIDIEDSESIPNLY